MMNKLLEKATNHAQQNFPISEEGVGDVIRNDVAFHSFIAGYNSACKEFKECLEKKKDNLANYHKIWLPDEKSRLCYREKVDLIDEILSELLSEQDNSNDECGE